MLFSSWSHLPNIVNVYFPPYNCTESSVHRFCGFQAQPRGQSCCFNHLGIMLFANYMVMISNSPLGCLQLSLRFPVTEFLV